MTTSSPAMEELERAACDFGDRLSSSWCSELQCYGVGDDLNWGFRVYRTVYTPGSDQDFATGLEILTAHLRRDIFYDAKQDCEDEEPLDDFPNHQIWQRLRLDVIDDPTAFDGAPPATIQKHFQTWIEEQDYYLPNAKSPAPSLEMAGSPAYRFCIIIDAEVLHNLFRYPIQPEMVEWKAFDRIGVKILDVECNEDNEEYPPPFDEGWLWAGPRDLTTVWFDYPMCAAEEIRDEDELGRPCVNGY